MHGKRPEFQDKAFSVIYVVSGEYKMLNLVAPSREECALWISGLHMLIGQTDISGGDPARLDQSMGAWLRKQWNEADTTGDGKLDLDEVTELMKKLNIRLSKSEVKSAFKNADIGRFGSLTFTAFERFYRGLRFRPEISELFSSLSVARGPVLTFDEFRNFVLNTQRNEWTDERCADVYRKYAAPDGGQMSIDHFSAFLLSSTNSNFKKIHSSVFQDMTRPLTDYYINTSHNTTSWREKALSKAISELCNEGSVVSNVRNKLAPPRVQLPPLMYVAFFQLIVMTVPMAILVGKLLFKDVIEAIAKYAFVASPYPLTLSLESHCGIEQQAVMANVLREHLGELLLRRSLAEHETELPSPEALKNKIIIKGKILAGGAGDDEAEYETEDEDEASLHHAASLTEISPAGTTPSIPRPTSRRMVGSFSEEADQLTQRRYSDEDLALARTRSSPKMARKYMVAKPLSELLVYCKGVHFQTFAHANEKFSFDFMCSLSEKKSLSLLQRHRQEYIKHTSRWLTRIYPAGIRVTSSNYDPAPHWAVGAQMVAMNIQTYDRGMQLNDAIFSLNGRSGYVLKPAALRGLSSQPRHEPVTLKLQVISGQQLPKPKDSTGGTVIDPFVEVEIVGREADAARYRTRAISNNGFNPMWKEEFTFVITDLETALLRFCIFDMDVKLSNDYIGSYVIPLQSLESGTEKLTNSSRVKQSLTSFIPGQDIAMCRSTTGRAT
ncbi:1-phosphatidylinositol 4,5-bisphosphate phosphodiesterase delta-4 [Thoreauomyces humboldtii]|nr:1-phosphatidylinositol 4,5-bisphosphate phosphodiesterase delta-4 [Thoreauomyces humboldtii]